MSAAPLRSAGNVDCRVKAGSYLCSTPVAGLWPIRRRVGSSAWMS